jgi:Na+-driven multidrug efflux pump
MVDRIFIGHIPDVGSLAISGLAVTFPLMNISTAFGTLVGVGAATMISVLLGQKNYAVANKVLSNEVTLNIITGIIFTFVTLVWMNPILRFFGASESTLPYARDYMVLIACGNAVTHLYFGLNSVIRSSGNPKTAMGLTLFTVTSNAILDPLFIFGFKMGSPGRGAGDSPVPADGPLLHPRGTSWTRTSSCTCPAAARSSISTGASPRSPSPSAWARS